MSIVSSAKVLLLAGIGFALGLFGISAFQDRSPLSSLTNTVESKRALASSCVPDAHAQEEPEIFFVSCGGLF